MFIIITITIIIISIIKPVFHDELLTAVDGAVAVHHHHRGREIE